MPVVARAIGILVVFALAVIVGFPVGYLSGENAAAPEARRLRYHRYLVKAAPKAPDTPDQLLHQQCNYEGFVVYKIAMQRYFGESLDQVRAGIMELHKDYETNPQSMANMIFMGLVAQQVYLLIHMEPVDMAIGYYNDCRRREPQEKPDVEL